MKVAQVSPLLFLLSITLVILPGFTATSLAQKLSKDDKKQEKRALKEADIEYELEKYPLALPYYQEAHRVNGNNPLTNFRLGICYKEIRDHENAVVHLERSYKLQPDVDPHVLYHLADMYHHTMEFDRAIETFKKYGRQTSKGYYADAVEKRIQECEYGKEYVDNPQEVFVSNLGANINSKYSEYAPVLSADERVMVFTSRREGSVGGELDMTGTYYEDIYIAEKDDKGNWQKPVNMDAINTAVHDASVGITPNGKNLIIFKMEGMGDLFYCKQNKDGTWVKPKRFPKQISAKDSYEPSGTIANDGTLYFASDRKGGYGGMDLYMCKPKGENEWGKAVNLGPKINTPYDEDAPFIDIDNRTLYFSSEGHTSMGDHDIFRAVADAKDGSWSDPENLGYPINSTDDDIFFVMSGDGRSAYFNSIKKDGYGGEDIYRLTFDKPVENAEERIALVEEITGTKLASPKPEPAPKPENTGEIQRVVLKGKVMEKGSGLVLFDAQVDLHDSHGNTLGFLDLDEKGKYIFKMPEKEFGMHEIRATMEGYGDVSIAVNVPRATTEKQVIENNLYMVKGGASNRVRIQPKEDDPPLFASEMQPDPEPEPDPEPKLEAKPEPVARPQKETKPVVVQGTITDRSTGRTLSGAKIELTNSQGKVIDKTQVSGSGLFKFVLPASARGKHTVTVEKQGYLFQTKVVQVPAPTTSPKILYADVSLPKPQLTGKIILRNIYYDFDRYSLTSESYTELKKLVKLMNNQSGIKAEIVSHTDNVGPDFYNKNLSQRRSNAVVRYLIKQGIDRNRLVAKGMGENRPMASNDDELEGRELNRRTEFIIRGL